ncbi:Hypothetical protein FKW44_007861 [Caligus rogercresseyi]|uniref:Uncharacterized protein n=1 Tax=Caligus rogercresseyi TaxID=217165 RepID=A0A7T8KFC5_CALRO|nr:Hypothetical protein FKW44_007861 [Caligus rogercresseyi]
MDLVKERSQRDLQTLKDNSVPRMEKKNKTPSKISCKKKRKKKLSPSASVIHNALGTYERARIRMRKKWS